MQDWPDVGVLWHRRNMLGHFSRSHDLLPQLHTVRVREHFGLRVGRQFCLDADLSALRYLLYILVLCFLRLVALDACHAATAVAVVQDLSRTSRSEDSLVQRVDKRRDLLILLYIPHLVVR